MKKKGGVRNSKRTANKSNSFKENLKRNWKFILIILVLLSLLFVLSYIGSNQNNNAAGDRPAPTAWSGESLGDTFKNFFTEASWTKENAGVNVAKIFFFLIVSIAIYLIIGSFFPKGKFLMFFLSLLIGFLATAYIAPNEIYSLLSSYTALGLTITTLIPIAILFGLTYRAATAAEGQPQLAMFQWFAWILFAIYSLYRFIYDWAVGKEGGQIMNVILLVTAAGALVMSLPKFNQWIIKIISRKYIKSLSDAEKAEFGKAVGFLKNAANAGEELG